MKTKDKTTLVLGIIFLFAFAYAIYFKAELHTTLLWGGFSFALMGFAWSGYKKNKKAL